MTLILIILGLMTAWLAFINDRPYPLEFIGEMSKWMKIIDAIALGVAVIVVIFFSEKTSVQIVGGAGLYVVLLGIQQEIFKNMREKFVVYVEEKSSEMVFVPKMIIDGMPMLEMIFDEEDSFTYLAAYIGEDELELDKAYKGLSVCVVFNRRGEPDYVCCQ